MSELLCVRLSYQYPIHSPQLLVPGNDSSEIIRICAKFGWLIRELHSVASQSVAAGMVERMLHVANAMGDCYESESSGFDGTLDVYCPYEPRLIEIDPAEWEGMRKLAKRSQGAQVKLDEEAPQLFQTIAEWIRANINAGMVSVTASSWTKPRCTNGGGSGWNWFQYIHMVMNVVSVFFGGSARLPKAPEWKLALLFAKQGNARANEYAIKHWKSECLRLRKQPQPVALTFFASMQMAAVVAAAVREKLEALKFKPNVFEVVAATTTPASLLSGYATRDYTGEMASTMSAMSTKTTMQWTRSYVPTTAPRTFQSEDDGVGTSKQGTGSIRIASSNKRGKHRN